MENKEFTDVDRRNHRIVVCVNDKERELLERFARDQEIKLSRAVRFLIKAGLSTMGN